MSIETALPGQPSLCRSFSAVAAPSSPPNLRSEPQPEILWSTPFQLKTRTTADESVFAETRAEDSSLGAAHAPIWKSQSEPERLSNMVQFTSTRKQKTVNTATCLRAGVIVPPPRSRCLRPSPDKRKGRAHFFGAFTAFLSRDASRAWLKHPLYRPSSFPLRLQRWRFCA